MRRNRIYALHECSGRRMSKNTCRMSNRLHDALHMTLTVRMSQHLTTSSGILGRITKLIAKLIWAVGEAGIGGTVT